MSISNETMLALLLGTDVPLTTIKAPSGNRYMAETTHLQSPDARDLFQTIAKGQSPQTTLLSAKPSHVWRLRGSHVFHVRITGEQNHRQIGANLGKPPGKLQASQLGHALIKNDRINAVRVSGKVLQRLFRVRLSLRFIPHKSEGFGHHRAQCFIIIDKEDPHLPFHDV